MEDKVIELNKTTTANAIYIFADIRGFTDWARSYQLEIDRLLSLMYTLAVETFGGMRSTAYLKRVVKFLGDGFFAVNEYPEDDPEAFRKKLLESFGDILRFISGFKVGIQKTNIHNKSKLSFGLGVSYGTSRRFFLKNFPTDYAGDRVNLASRLCSAAGGNQIVCESDLLEYLQELQDRGSIKLIDSSTEKLAIRGFGELDILRIKDARSSTARIIERERIIELVEKVKRLSGAKTGRKRRAAKAGVEEKNGLLLESD